MNNLFLIAEDLQYYGYTFEYFYENYCNFLERQKAKNIWQKTIYKLERI